MTIYKLTELLGISKKNPSVCEHLKSLLLKFKTGTRILIGQKSLNKDSSRVGWISTGQKHLKSFVNYTEIMYYY